MCIYLVLRADIGIGNNIWYAFSQDIMCQGVCYIFSFIWESPMRFAVNNRILILAHYITEHLAVVYIGCFWMGQKKL